MKERRKYLDALRTVAVGGGSALSRPLITSALALAVVMSGCDDDAQASLEPDHGPASGKADHDSVDLGGRRIIKKEVHDGYDHGLVVPIADDDKPFAVRFKRDKPNEGSAGYGRSGVPYCVELTSGATLKDLYSDDIFAFDDGGGVVAKIWWLPGAEDRDAENAWNPPVWDEQCEEAKAAGGPNYTKVLDSTFEYGFGVLIKAYGVELWISDRKLSEESWHDIDLEEIDFERLKIKPEEQRRFTFEFNGVYRTEEEICIRLCGEVSEPDDVTNCYAEWCGV